jgi:tetratricopeptide (TPR) repeat protein
MFLAKPYVGVGWDNFGQHYLAYRLPAAAEEIQDPHNFLLRFLTELGIVGAVLVIAWQARLWWEMTRPRQPRADHENIGGLGLIAAIAAAGISVSFLCGEDFSQPAATLALEVMTRLLYLCVLLLGASAAGIKSLQDQNLDDRPSPWVLAAIVASLGAFLIHNLIEFSLFETGPLMIFALLAGSVLGIRGQSRQPAGKPLAWAAMGGAAIVWLVAAAGFVIPVIMAESVANDGDDAIRAQRFDEAAQDYLQAYQDHVNYNPDYLFRAAQAMDGEPIPDRTAIQHLLETAIARNPSSVGYNLFLARFDTQINDAAGAVKHFSQALALNPNEVSIHLDFGDALMHFHRAADAAEQYELALKYNDLLPGEEPKRINDGLIRGRLATALLNMGERAQALEQCEKALADDAALPADDPRRLTPEEINAIQTVAARSH